MMLRFATPALLGLTLTAAPVAALDLDALNDTERAAFGEQVRSYLLENPEVLLEAFQILEQRQAEAEAMADQQLVAANADEIFDDGFSWVGGNPEGDVTVVEFMDYRCGYCRRAVPEVAQLLEMDDNIRFVIKEFPILGDASMMSSRFAVATKQVAGDAAYKQVHDALMEFGGEIGDVALRRLAEGLGLDPEPILARMDSDEVTEEIAQTHALAQRLQISGTPSFVMGDQLMRGYMTADQMLDIVEAIRAERE
ncbi:DsbA family protein [Lutimaribacter marinistellae]|uniref:DsbA family protein n=1 Tax=Lutimaribacter marinistellae TaxID=1820329 RepID=A0ABV7THK9_9RHOB